MIIADRGKQKVRGEPVQPGEVGGDEACSRQVPEGGYWLPEWEEEVGPQGEDKKACFVRRTAE